VIIALSFTVFELFDVEYYRDLEIWVRGHSTSFKLVLFESLGVVSYSPSIVTMALSCIILEIKRDISKKSWFFSYPLYSTPPLGMSLSDYCLPVWFGKTRMMALRDGEKSLTICLPVLTECTNVTDRQTHRQTDRRTPHDGKGRAWCKHRAVKIVRFWWNMVK